MQTNNSSNQVKPDEFRVGDIVWCLLYGKGEVSSLMGDPEGDTYPMEVCFENGDGNWYTLDGKLDEVGNRTLFFSEPKIEASVTRPFVPTLVGKMVVVKEPACHLVCIKIGFENQETFGGGGYSFRKALVEVYEVSSENLLKS